MDDAPLSQADNERMAGLLSGVRGTPEHEEYLVVLAGVTTEPLEAYLIETRDLADEPTELRLLGPGTLTGFLQANMEHAHYAGDEAEVTGIWRWAGPGKLTALTVVCTQAGQVDDRDFIHSKYALYPAALPAAERADHGAELVFTLTLDGRV